MLLTEQRACRRTGSARCIADVYDALSVRRIYKVAFPHEDCVRIIRDEAGTHFNPQLVEVFLSIQGEFREIAERFRAVEDRRNAEGL